jgi:hypothetical protein
MAVLSEFTVIYDAIYRYAPLNDVSVNGRPHIRRWSHNSIIPLCYN